MLAFVLRRTVAALGTLLGVLTLVFALMTAAPGDPAQLLARSGGARRLVSSEAVEAFRATYGLDRPVPARFARWLVHAATLDFGRSFTDGRPVTLRIQETLPSTLALNAGALLAAALIALLSGILAARRPGAAFDRVSGFVFDVLFAMPAFVVGMLLLLVFAVKLRWLPLFADSGSFSGLLLPVSTLALASLAPLARFVRACLLKALRAPATTAARARGESAWEETSRALRRSLVPFFAMGAAILPAAVSGSVLVERLFSMKGSGELLAEAVFARDYPMVLGLTFLVTTVVVLGSLAADVLSAVVDPRTRETGATA